jgi:simple sugar transport system permease protein
MDIVILISLAFRAMIPLTVTAIGEIVTEQGGVINIGLEGIMVISAFVSVVGTKATGSAWLGLLVGILAGAVIGLLHGVLSVYLKGNQVISGVGINLFGLGIVGFGVKALWGGPLQLKVAWQLTDIPTPWGGLSPVLFMMLALALGTWWVLFRTTLGLRIRSVGENPAAADVAGLSVNRIRLGATIYGGALGGLAGAFLALGWTHTITSTLPAGRGFIALANVVFSKLNPLLALLGGFIFGFFDALALWISNVPAVNAIIPYQFIRMTPYLVTLIVLTGVIGRARFPKAIGEPYRRE